MIVSVALPVYNAQEFLDECFESILKQNLSINDHNKKEKCQDQEDIEIKFSVEVSVYDDGSTDSSPTMIDKWAKIFNSTPGFSFQLSKNDSGSPKGVGFARNETIRQSTGEYLCFCDADDIMEPQRISAQLKLNLQHPEAIVGSKFRRLPADSTRNFTYWANSLTQRQLETQIYLTFGPTIVMPTWFCHRNVYDRIEGGFSESGKGTPEDLIFFYKHLDQNGMVARVDEELMVYRYHSSATTFSVTDEIIRNIRLQRLESEVLNNWSKFSIWNAGKLGRRFYRSLSPQTRQKVTCFCDVDKKKIAQKWYHPHPIKEKVPIVHVKDASPPFVICVKTEITWDATGDFRRLLESMNLEEGVNYYYFN
ncbi:unnamed protein product [Orchesella dallaii]|uniref:Glycosyltransferase 2-like domain-containing protein n=1 Tax=Orchesella dallaii TaxID=48710 RepID=A0ABP1RM80_9HEXA